MNENFIDLLKTFFFCLRYSKWHIAREKKFTIAFRYAYYDGNLFNFYIGYFVIYNDPC